MELIDFTNKLLVDLKETALALDEVKVYLSRSELMFISDTIEIELDRDSFKDYMRDIGLQTVKLKLFVSNGLTTLLGGELGVDLKIFNYLRYGIIKTSDSIEYLIYKDTLDTESPDFDYAVFATGIISTLGKWSGSIDLHHRKALIEQCLQTVDMSVKDSIFLNETAGVSCDSIVLSIKSPHTDLKQLSLDVAIKQIIFKDILWGNVQACIDILDELCNIMTYRYKNSSGTTGTVAQKLFIKLIGITVAKNKYTVKVATRFRGLTSFDLTDEENNEIKKIINRLRKVCTVEIV